MDPAAYTYRPLPFLATLRRAIGAVRSKQDSILTLVDELPALSPRDRKSTRRFLEKFFAEAEKEDRLLASFKRRCIKH